MPDLTSPLPPITGEMLTRAFNQVLDSTVPGSALIKVMLGTAESPQTIEQCLHLALDVALDLLPGGKLTKLSKSPSVKLGLAKMKKLLGKKAMKKATGQVLQSGGHTLSKRTLKALGLTKGQGNEAIHMLKRNRKLPNNFHGQILANGDYIHPQTKELLGNIFDYVR